MKDSGIGAAMMTYEGKRLDEFLTKDEDRKLFGLNPLPKPVVPVNS
jgi:hypothetical protein